MLHHLRIFFIDSFDRGDLAVKPPSEEDQSPEAVYAAWLHRQYTAYTAALLRLLGDAEAEPRTQVGGGRGQWGVSVGSRGDERAWLRRLLQRATTAALNPFLSRLPF